MPLYEAARDLGLKVPGDLSILSFSPERQLNVTGVAFTTMATPETAQGRAAVQMLLYKIDRHNQSMPSQALASRLIEGATCAPVRCT